MPATTLDVPFSLVLLWLPVIGLQYTGRWFGDFLECNTRHKTSSGLPKRWRFQNCEVPKIDQNWGCEGQKIPPAPERNLSIISEK